MANWIEVAQLNDIPDGGVRVVEVDTRMIAIFRVGDECFALDDQCTHDGGELASGMVIGSEVICPRHGAKFDIRSGRVTSPPATEDVRAYPVRIEAGRVLIGTG
jgi:3-phenylpropionate/trans-cinnamate dioxygenase ferredoxin subunit